MSLPSLDKVGVKIQSKVVTTTSLFQETPLHFINQPFKCLNGIIARDQSFYIRSMTIRPENCLRMDDLRMRSYYVWKSKIASFTQLLLANEQDARSFKLLTSSRIPTVISHFKRRIAFQPADQSLHTFSCFVWGVPSVYVWSMN